jgi:hypothetical protein
MCDSCVLLSCAVVYLVQLHSHDLVLEIERIHAWKEPHGNSARFLHATRDKVARAANVRALDLDSTTHQQRWPLAIGPYGAPIL